MHYTENLPDDLLSHHIESYWELSTRSLHYDSPLELLLPTCTFNIVFVDRPCKVWSQNDAAWKDLSPAAYFLGQRNTSIHIKSKYPIKLFGSRFKPFAFTNKIDIPIFKLNDQLLPLEEVFSLSDKSHQLTSEILHQEDADIKHQLTNELMYGLFKKSMSLDERLRAQLNFIMDRRGCVKINDLVDIFKVSKVTLRKHFVNKVGLTPKRVSQIWRMNHLLQMREDQPEENLTALCLDAGFYDQAHFIKEFKQVFKETPKRFFIENSRLVRSEHQHISKRFSNQYDPR